MAKIQFSGLASDVRGTIGGITFSASAQGSYVRAWKQAKRPTNVLQLFQQCSYGHLSQLWRGLDPADILSWQTLSALYPKVDSLGNTYYLNGFMMFMMCNRNLIAIGEDIIETAPDIAQNVFPDRDDEELLIVTAPGSETYGLLYTADGVGDHTAILQCTPSISEGISKPSAFSKLKTFSYNAASPCEFQDEFLAKFGSYTPSETSVWVKLWLVHNSAGFADSPKIIRGAGLVI